jgi:hypothetical protein
MKNIKYKFFFSTGYLVLFFAVFFLFTSCEKQFSVEKDPTNGDRSNQGGICPNSATNYPECDRFSKVSLLEKPEVIYKPADHLNSEHRFSYAPSVIDNGDDLLHVFSCHNPESGSYDDHIFYTQFKKQGSSRLTVENSFSFYAGNRSVDWNACDPTVVQGQFHYQDKVFEFAVFYTAMPLDAYNRIISGHENRSEYNEVRLLLFRYLSNGTVDMESVGSLFQFQRKATDEESYGYGQPSAVSLNQKGQILLLYTHGRKEKDQADADWKTFFRILDIENVSHPTVSEEHLLSNKDIVNITNGDYAYYDNRLYVITEDPLVWLTGRKVASALRILSIPLDPQNIPQSLVNGKWAEVLKIGAAQTQWTLNHNAGWVRNGFGHLFSNSPQLMLTVGDGDQDPIEWTYQLSLGRISIL